MNRLFVTVVLALSSVGFSRTVMAEEGRGAMVTGSRPPEKGCVWKRVRSEGSRFSLLVQDCDYGFRKVTHSIKDYALMQKFSDSPEADQIIEVFGKDEVETPPAALRKKFIEMLEPYEKEHCIPVEVKPEMNVQEMPFKNPSKSAWVITPDREYMTKIMTMTPKDEIPENACGRYGLPFDSRAYFEFHSGSKKNFAWVIIGQNTPLFDEQSLDF